MYRPGGFFDARADADDCSNSTQICSLKGFSCPHIIKCDCFADAQHDGIGIAGHMAFVSSITDSNAWKDSAGSHSCLREMQEWKVFIGWKIFVDRNESAEVSLEVLVTLIVGEFVSPSHAKHPDSVGGCLVLLGFGVFKHERAVIVSIYPTELPEYSSPLTPGRFRYLHGAESQERGLEFDQGWTF